MAQETQTGALYQSSGVGWGRRLEGGSRGRGYMYMYGSVAKNLPDNVGDAVSISGSRRPPREGNGNPLHLPGKSHG